LPFRAKIDSVVRNLVLVSWLAALCGQGCAAAESRTVGPFTVEAVERKVSAGGFPNTSGNPFQRAPVTQYRISFNGKPVPLPGAGKSRAPWWEVRVLTGAPQPALLVMETGAYLLTEADGRPHLEELAPRLSSHTEWQWLDAEAGQPGPKNIVGLEHRPDQPLELSGGRWLSVFGEIVLDVKTLAIHRYKLNSTEVLDQLQRFYAAGKPILAFSPGGTQFVVAGERDRPDESDLDKRFEWALIAFDFTRQQGTVLPIDLAAWRLEDGQQIDTAFARKVVAWRIGPDGREVAYLRDHPP
jgi:hypothetical protein